MHLQFKIDVIILTRNENIQNQFLVKLLHLFYELDGVIQSDTNTHTTFEVCELYANIVLSFITHAPSARLHRPNIIILVDAASSAFIF